MIDAAHALGEDRARQDARIAVADAVDARAVLRAKAFRMLRVRPAHTPSPATL